MNDIERLADRRRRIIGWLWASAGFLALVHVALLVVKFRTGHNFLHGILPLFDLDGEGNLPTLFSTLLLMACAALLGCIAAHERRRHGPFAFRWTVLAAGFAFMAVDEFAKVHELFDEPMQALMGESASGWLLYTWVVPYAIAVVALGIYFLKFVWHLPKSTRIRFCVAGAVYVGAALGIEFLEGAEASVHGEGSVGYAVLTTAQEMLEMTGLILFIDALLRYIRDHGVGEAIAAPHAAPVP